MESNRFPLASIIVRISLMVCGQIPGKCNRFCSPLPLVPSMPTPKILLRRLMLQGHQHDIVQLEIVWQGRHRLMRGLERYRLIVENPVADIFDACGRQIIERFEGLR